MLRALLSSHIRYTTPRGALTNFRPSPISYIQLSIRTMSRYAEAHKKPQGPGDARPTAMQIVEDDKLQAPALKDKVIVMTGASAGIGVETARALAATGARVFLGVRNMDKGRSACASFLEPGRVDLFHIDTSSLASVRAAAEEINSKTPTVNIIVNNAGIMAVPTQQLSADGFESQLATNYLGHFLLYRLLEPKLLASSTPSFHSRVVNVSSSGHHAGGIEFGNLNLADGAYEPWKAYGQSKTAVIYMANHIERLHGAAGLHGLSVMPGGIWTDLQKHVGDEMLSAWKKNPATASFIKTEAQGAATTVLAAVSKEWEGKGGEYLEDCAVAGPIPEGGRGAFGAAEHVHDEEKETKLWEEASKMVGLA